MLCATVCLPRNKTHKSVQNSKTPHNQKKKKRQNEYKTWTGLSIHVQNEVIIKLLQQNQQYECTNKTLEIQNPQKMQHVPHT